MSVHVTAKRLRYTVQWRSVLIVCCPILLTIVIAQTLFVVKVQQ